MGRSSAIPEAYRVVSLQIRRSERLYDLFFREMPEYPTFAWQEALVNAVAHRDYANQTQGWRSGCTKTALRSGASGSWSYR